MILLKVCTNCDGDVQCRKELDGIECRCLQCGRPLDMKTATALIEAASDSRLTAAAIQKPESQARAYAWACCCLSPTGHLSLWERSPRSGR